jgi:putative transposase
MAESFFATLECELLDRQSFRNLADAKMAIFDFLEGWYNPQRRHSSIGYVSPAVFEQRAEDALESRRATRFRGTPELERYDLQTGDQIPST